MSQTMLANDFLVFKRQVTGTLVKPQVIFYIQHILGWIFYYLKLANLLLRVFPSKKKKKKGELDSFWLQTGANKIGTTSPFVRGLIIEKLFKILRSLKLRNIPYNNHCPKAKFSNQGLCSGDEKIRSFAQIFSNLLKISNFDSLYSIQNIYMKLPSI